jgi:broad specificity phosphatase PhoE
MTDILDQVSWGASSRLLLQCCMQLQDAPAVMLVRHSEVDYSNITESDFPLDPSLTRRGHHAAVAFGTRLPRDRTYRLFHTDRLRTRQTAESIQQGLQTQGCETEVDGEMLVPAARMPVRTVRAYLQRENAQGDAFWKFVINWVSNRYPPWQLEPSHTITQRIAYSVMTNLQNSDDHGFDIYVSHDGTILALLFHWFGVFKHSRPDFLDGFITHFHQDIMTLRWKHGSMETWYPYWMKHL